MKNINFNTLFKLYLILKKELKIVIIYFKKYFLIVII